MTMNVAAAVAVEAFTGLFRAPIRMRVMDIVRIVAVMVAARRVRRTVPLRILFSVCAQLVDFVRLERSRQQT